MLNIRSISIAVFCLIALAIAADSAAAQTATSTSPGKPLSLVPSAPQKSRLKTHSHPAAIRVAKKADHKTPAHVPAQAQLASTPEPAAQQAANQPQPDAPETATVALPPDLLPGTAAATPAPDSMQSAAPAAPAAPVTNEAVVNMAPNEIVTGAHTVQPAATKEVNAPDLAAADGPAAHQTTGTTATPADTAAPAPVVHAMTVTVAAHSASPVGSLGWIAQVLAALASAIAIGTVAWFMICCPAPERSYT